MCGRTLKMAISFRQKRIYREQDAVLAALKKFPHFPYILSGGTALSRFYFHHRFSEDLDFFCEEFTFSFAKIEGVVNFLRREGFICELSGRTDEPGRIRAASYTVKGNLPIKVDFLEDPFSGMWKPVDRKTESGLSFRVDSPDQVYYRKFFSLLEQWHRTGRIQRGKDLMDLYVLHSCHRRIEETLALFRKNHVPHDEEKIVMILSSIRRGEVPEKVRTAFAKSVERILKKGLGR